MKGTSSPLGDGSANRLLERRRQTVKFSIVMTAFKTFSLLPRALTCVLQQEDPDWELLLMVDGPAPREQYAPRRLVDQLQRRRPQCRIELHELPRAAGCFGNAARHAGMLRATGDYVCWVNHDNLIAPRYLAAHAENFASTPECVSVVDIDLWKHDRYFGRYPRAFRCGRIDLLCFAVPLAAARRVNAFGGSMRPAYAADWLVFDACRQWLPVRHNRRLVGTHF